MQVFMISSASIVFVGMPHRSAGRRGRHLDHWTANRAGNFIVRCRRFMMWNRTTGSRAPV
jgi:hypothetical protein